MNRNEPSCPINDERAERLICRHLDGEATPAEHEELLRLIDSSADVRRLLDDYAEIDGQVTAALRSLPVAAGRSIAFPGSAQRSFPWPRLVSTLGVAAVIAALLVSGWLRTLSPSPPQAPRSRGRIPAIAINHEPSNTWTAGLPDAVHLVDYRDVDFQPQVRQRRTASEWIGIPDRKRGGEVIYILERDRRADRIVPVAGDF